MSDYARIKLSTLTIDGEPGPLPLELVGLEDVSLADLPAAIDPVPAGFEDTGFWLVVEADVDAPQVDAETRRYRVPRPPVPAPDMPALRAAALATAMAYGNAITDKELSTWTGAEPLSWAQQREESRSFLRGETLDELALIPGLAQDKGVSVADYARTVVAHAARYQTIVRVAVQLRRQAELVFGDVSIDTPEKLEAARAALRTQVDGIAAGLLAAPIPVPVLATEGFIPTSLFRLRAEKLGIWDEISAYLSQSPPLWMRVFSLDKGLLDPADPDLIDGLGGAGVKPGEKQYLLAHPELGVPDVAAP